MQFEIEEPQENVCFIKLKSPFFDNKVKTRAVLCEQFWYQNIAKYYYNQSNSELYIQLVLLFSEFY